MIRLRAALAFVLVATLALPAYTCDGYRDSAGKLVESIPSGADSAAYTPTKVPHRPIETLDLTAGRTWLILATYLWPLAVVGVLAWRPRVRGRWPFMAVELVLVCASAWIIQWVVVIGDIAYGAVVSLVALGLMAAVAVADFVMHRKSMRASAPTA